MRPLCGLIGVAEAAGFATCPSTTKLISAMSITTVLSPNNYTTTPYAPNMTCTYLINALPNNIHQFTVAFPGCQSDLLRVYDGPSRDSPMMMALEMGPGVTLVRGRSSGPYLYVELISSPSLRPYTGVTGFSLVTTPMGPVSTCNGTATLNVVSGSPFGFEEPFDFADTSSLYSYLPNMLCACILTADPGFSLRVTRLTALNSFSTGRRLQDGDSITVYRGNTTTAPVAAVWNNDNRTPLDVVLVESPALIVFLSRATAKVDVYGSFGFSVLVAAIPSTPLSLVASTAGTLLRNFVSNTHVDKSTGASPSAWLIKSGGPGDVVELTVTTLFDCFDVEFYDGATTSAPRMIVDPLSFTPACAGPGDVIRSSGQDLLVVTNGGMNNYIMLGYAAVASNTTCHGTTDITAVAGTIAVPAPFAAIQARLPMTACAFHVKNPSGMTIIFNHFNWGFTDAVFLDRVTFYNIDAQGRRWPFFTMDYDFYLNNFCPTELYSSTSEVLIEYDAGPLVGHGFTFDFVGATLIPEFVQCAPHIVVNTPACISTPLTFDGYHIMGSNLTCAWVLTATVSKRAAMTVTGMDLRAGIDFLRIFDGSNAAAPLLAEYTGVTIDPMFPTPLPTVIARGQYAFIQLVTGPNVTTQAGFSMDTIDSIAPVPPPTLCPPVTLFSNVDAHTVRYNDTMYHCDALYTFTVPADAVGYYFMGTGGHHIDVHEGADTTGRRVVHYDMIINGLNNATGYALGTTITVHVVSNVYAVRPVVFTMTKVTSAMLAAHPLTQCSGRVELAAPDASSAFSSSTTSTWVDALPVYSTSPQDYVYAQGLQCEWLFSAPDVDYIVVFERMESNLIDIAEGDGYFAIFDGTSRAAPLLYNFTSSYHLPDTQLPALSGNMLVVFETRARPSTAPGTGVVFTAFSMANDGEYDYQFCIGRSLYVSATNNFCPDLTFSSSPSVDCSVVVVGAVNSRWSSGTLDPSSHPETDEVVNVYDTPGTTAPLTSLTAADFMFYPVNTLFQTTSNVIHLAVDAGAEFVREHSILEYSRITNTPTPPRCSGRQIFDTDTILGTYRLRVDVGFGHASGDSCVWEWSMDTNFISNNYGALDFTLVGALRPYDRLDVYADGQLTGTYTGGNTTLVLSAAARPTGERDTAVTVNHCQSNVTMVFTAGGQNEYATLPNTHDAWEPLAQLGIVASHVGSLNRACFNGTGYCDAVYPCNTPTTYPSGQGCRAVIYFDVDCPNAVLDFPLLESVDYWTMFVPTNTVINMPRLTRVGELAISLADNFTLVLPRVISFARIVLCPTILSRMLNLTSVKYIGSLSIHAGFKGHLLFGDVNINSCDLTAGAYGSMRGHSIHIDSLNTNADQFYLFNVSVGLMLGGNAWAGQQGPEEVTLTGETVVNQMALASLVTVSAPDAVTVQMDIRNSPNLRIISLPQATVVDLVVVNAALESVSIPRMEVGRIYLRNTTVAFALQAPSLTLLGQLYLRNTGVTSVEMPQLNEGMRFKLVDNPRLASIQACQLATPITFLRVINTPLLACADVAFLSNLTQHYLDVRSNCSMTTVPLCGTVVIPINGCADPGAPLNGSRDGGPGPFAWGAVVHFSCPAGMVVLGPISASCSTLLGGWTTLPLACVAPSGDGAPVVTSVAPMLAALNTAVNVTISGARWAVPLRTVTGNGVVVRSGVGDVGGSVDAQYVVVEAPAQGAAGYYTLAIEDGLGDVAINDDLYFTDDCPNVGTFGKGVDCQPCPVGGYCPGGDRIWPLVGYWNPGESSGFVVACSEPPSRCSGGRTASCDVGYTGPLCGNCAPGYYPSATECLACPAASAVTNLYIAAGVFYFFMTLAFAFLPDEPLHGVITAIRVLQLVRAASVQAGSRLPTDIKSGLQYLSLLTFDFSFMKPACAFNSGTPISTIFWGNAVVIVCFAVPPLLLLGVLRLVVASKRALFTDRIFRALLVQVSLLYFVVTTRTFEATYYIKIGPQWLLQADTSVALTASPTLIVGVLGLVVVTGLAPVAFTAAAKYLVAHPLEKNPKLQSRLGFLFSGLRMNGRRHFYVGLPLVHLFLTAVSWTVLKNGLAPYLLTLASFTVMALITLIVRPYERGFENAIALVSYGFGLASLLLSFLSLSYVRVSVNDAWLAAGVVGGASVLFGLVMIWHDSRTMGAHLQASNKVAPAPLAPMKHADPLREKSFDDIASQPVRTSVALVGREDADEEESGEGEEE